MFCETKLNQKLPQPTVFIPGPTNPKLAIISQSGASPWNQDFVQNLCPVITGVGGGGGGEGGPTQHLPKGDEYPSDRKDLFFCVFVPV